MAPRLDVLPTKQMSGLVARHSRSNELRMRTQREPLDHTETAVLRTILRYGRLGDPISQRKAQALQELVDAGFIHWDEENREYLIEADVAYSLGYVPDHPAARAVAAAEALDDLWEDDFDPADIDPDTLPLYRNTEWDPLTTHAADDLD